MALDTSGIALNYLVDNNLAADGTQKAGLAQFNPTLQPAQTLLGQQGFITPISTVGTIAQPQRGSEVRGSIDPTPGSGGTASSNSGTAGTTTGTQAPSSSTNSPNGISFGNWTIKSNKAPEWVEDVAGTAAAALTGVITNASNSGSDSSMAGGPKNPMNSVIIPAAVGGIVKGAVKGKLYYPTLEYTPTPDTPEDAAARQRVETDRQRIRTAMDKDGVYDPGFKRSAPGVEN